MEDTSTRSLWSTDTEQVCIGRCRTPDVKLGVTGGSQGVFQKVAESLRVGHGESECFVENRPV